MGKDSITGIILCGSNNKYINEKAIELLRFRDKTLIEHVIEALSKVCDNILISANCENYNLLPYPAFIELYQNQGLLGGVHGGLKLSESDKNLVVPCNMPLIDKQVLNDMIAAAYEADVVVTFNKEKTFHLPMLLRKSALQKVKNMILNGEKDVDAFLAKVNSKKILWKEAEKHPEVRSVIHTLDDLQKLENK